MHVLLKKMYFNQLLGHRDSLVQTELSQRVGSQSELQAVSRVVSSAAEGRGLLPGALGTESTVEASRVSCINGDGFCPLKHFIRTENNRASNPQSK